ncbi:MAG TPA: hypothetical protein VF556_02785 [Pyrinomonadaceae bacterium]|jgi:hypothetical protein
MNVTDLQEIWQVDVNGQIYEAGFEELGQWILEGALLRQDKVRRGSLRWIEAQKVPGLIKYFNQKETGAPEFSAPALNTVQTSNDFQTSPPNFPISSNPFQTDTNSNETQPGFSNFSDSPNPFQNEQNFDQPAFDTYIYEEQDFSNLSENCCIHTESESEYFCDTCRNAFCKTCPSSYGGSVKICPFCGAMCKSTKNIQQHQQKQQVYKTAISEGFGFVDFSRALGFPFKYVPSLVFGTILFVIFSLGQSVASFGGFLMAGAALFCLMASNMLTFGVLTNTVANFSQGKLEANFMPDFDDFSIWDDVVHPFFLAVGVYLVSFGLFVVIIIGGIWYTFSAVSAETNKALINKAQQIGEARREGRVTDRGEIIMKGNEMPPEAQRALEEGDFAKMQKILEEHRRKEFETIAGNSSEKSQAEYGAMIKKLSSFALPFFLLLTIAFLWGIFYLPAACAVAGYTRSFAATINPTIGLDTIKRLGFDYAKIWMMGFLICIFTGITGLLLGFVFSPLDLPMLGNIPAKIISAVFGFYFTIVFSCILGYALFKNADKLNLYRD